MTQATKLLDINNLSVEAAVTKLADYAINMPASDIFVCTNEQHVAVTVRYLGIVQPLAIASADQGKRFIQHVKALAGMDLAERRRPQDGRWMHETENGEQCDMRINMIPTMYGEDLAARILPRKSQMLDVEQLGMTDPQLQVMNGLLDAPSGMILITGPTGAGKTASLYACLQRLNDGRKKINTIEDPIEYSVEGLRQSQINPRLDLHFAEFLRAILRQSPDVIMIGEIRDNETAETAVRAANSGHLVFATLHAPIAAAAVQSMRSLGVPHHFLATSLRGIVAQRLVRTLCPRCRVSFDLEDAPHTFDEVRHLLGPEEGKVLYAPAGCESCHMSGYAGRNGVFEVIPITRDIRNLISDGEPIRAIRAKAIEQGMLDFRQGALMKVAKGLTSTEEVFRAIPSEHLTLDD